MGEDDYRTQFAARGSSTLMKGAWDTRRMMSWAPYAVVPSVAIASKFLPKKHRIRAWVGTLVLYGIARSIMYNTDTSSDDAAPVLIQVSRPDRE